MERKFQYQIEKIADNTYRIDEAGTNCYLLTGSTKALLIDTGNGLGDLRAVVKNICGSLPLEVLITHAHADHIGGASQFEKIYLHEQDTAFIYKIASASFVSKSLIKNSPFLKEQGITKKDLVKGSFKPDIIKIQDGFSLDLGDRKIHIINTPGHTKGSLVLLDEKEKLMFTGDNVCPALWLFVPGAISVREWIPGAKRILSYAKEYTPYCGHGEGRQTYEQIEALIHLAEKIVAEEKNAVFGKLSIYPSKEALSKGEPTIWYRTSKVQ